MSMRGRLRHRVTIQKRRTASDGQGGETATIDTLATVWADVVPFQSQEGLFGGQRQEGEMSTVRIRYRGDVSTDMELLFRERKLKIIGVRNVEERDRWTMLTCVEED